MPIKIKKLRIAKKKTRPPSRRAILKRLKSGYTAKQKEQAGEAVPVRIEGGIQIPVAAVAGKPGAARVAAGGAAAGVPVGALAAYPAPEEERPSVEEAEEVLEGIEIVEKALPGTRPAMPEEREQLRSINMFYPLIPKVPKKGEYVYAYANIRWEPKMQGLAYYLVEPQMAESDRKLVENIKLELEERLDVDIGKLGTVQARETLVKQVQDILASMSVVIDENRRRAIQYYIERDTIGFGKIHALMQDPNVEDISCDGVSIPLFIYHRDPRFASVRTNVSFSAPDELNSFVTKLAQKCNKMISIADPLFDGSLPDGSRIQATLGTDIARKGSNFTIRKFTEKPLTPTQILKYRTANSLQMAYLWMAVENGMSVLVSGGTATGKTAMLNALSLFIRPELKVVSIEDTAELRLSLPHWIPHVARSPLSEKGKVGEVTLFDLLKSSLRQRPDYLVLGEVRGREAFVLFQQIATGHPAMATMHAASIPQLIDRLITPPISLPASLLENVDVIAFLTLSRLKGAYVRRMDSILEMVGVKGNRPVTNRVFEWDAFSDKFNIKKKSIVLSKIAKKSGLTPDRVKDELIRRKLVLDWMLEKDVTDYKEFSRIISMYYSNPERIMDLVRGT
ncbi:MAG: type II/IV secretion system ATPase subunit [Candidatus Aenigmarchaeota archaeon]